ncbi:MAG: glycosyltransferase [Actinomycetota bacterium]|nr:glycosyltransferase [Actinomycetota bacterium]
MTGISKQRFDRVSGVLAKVALSARTALDRHAITLVPGPGTVEKPRGGFVFGADGLALSTSCPVPQGRYLLLADPGTDGRVSAAAAGVARTNGQGHHTPMARGARGHWHGVVTVPADTEYMWLLFDVQRRQEARPSLRLVPLPDLLWRYAGPRIEALLSRGLGAPMTDYAQWRFARLVESQARAAGAGTAPVIDVLVQGEAGHAAQANATAVSLLGQSAAPGKVSATPSFAAMLEPWLCRALAARCDLEIVDRPEPGGNRVVAMRPGDRLAPEAVARYSEAAENHPNAQVIYADHDLLDAFGTPVSPYFKPAFSPLLLLSRDYLSRAACLGPMPESRSTSDGRIDPVSLAALPDDAEVAHIPRILHHLADGDEPAPARPGCQLLEEAPAYADRFFGARPARDTAPRASVLIPTAARPEIVRRCIESILSLTEHPDFEVLLDVNGPRAAELSELAVEMASRGPVRVVESSAGRHPDFNFAALVNGLAAQASGEHLVILNDDTEVISPGWLQDLCCYLDRPRVGAVGAKLLYPGGLTVQHAGMVLGVAGVAAHCFVGESSTEMGYQGYLSYSREVSALTGAALAIRAELYARLGGMDEANLAVSYNDVDLCLRAQESGHVNIMAPEALLIHHETVTRSKPTSGPALERERAEVAYLRERWKPEILEADPFYNPNLTLVYERLFSADPYPRPRATRSASVAPSAGGHGA